MSQHKIKLAINRLGKGLSLYLEALDDLNNITSQMCGGGITDLIDENTERQDALLSLREFSATPEMLIEWIEEYRSTNEEATQ